MTRSESADAHLKLYRDDPDKAHFIYPRKDGQPVTTLLLTTIGRKSGEPRTTPLIYKKFGSDYVLVASLGGAPNHPAWYLNLLETPDCEIQAGSTRLKARARVAGAERASLWAQMVDYFPDYAEYQRRTQREIPVLVLTPR